MGINFEPQIIKLITFPLTARATSHFGLAGVNTHSLTTAPPDVVLSRTYLTFLELFEKTYNASGLRIIISIRIQKNTVISDLGRLFTHLTALFADETVMIGKMGPNISSVIS